MNFPTTEYEMRKLLNSLSKEVYGSSSKWQKLVNNGVPEKQEVSDKTNVTHVLKRFSLIEVYQHMMEAKANRAAQIAIFEAQDLERQKKQAEEENKQKLAEAFAGSAV